MYPVTQDFIDKMRAPERRVLGRVQIDYTDPFLDQSIAVSASEQANVSYPAQTADAVAEPFAKIASLDGSWVLDGTFALAPATADEAETRQMGWWGSQLAGADGSFASPYPTLTVTHQPRPVHSLKVVGDSKRGEYAVDFTVKLYAADNTLLHTETVTGNNQVAWSKVLATPVLDVVKQELCITKWSHAGRQVKILEFFTSIQETYEGDDVLLIHLLEEREVSQGSLPVGNISANEIDIRLDNSSRKFDAGNTQSPLYQLLKQNRRIRAWLGIRADGQGQNFSKTETTQADFAAGTLTNVVATAAGDLELGPSHNLCPPFNQWTLYGTASIDADGNLVLNAYDDYAKSPLIPIDYAAEWTFSAEYYDDDAAPVSGANPDGSKAVRLINSRYYDAAGQPVANSAGYTGNGNAAAFGLPGSWSDRSTRWTYLGGPNVKYVQFSISANSTLTSASYKVRRPMVTVNYEYDPFEAYGGYHPNGQRLSPILDLSPVGIAAGSSISWTATAPAGTAVTVETNLSLDGGVTWQGWKQATNGGPVPGITPGLDLSNARLQTRVTLTTPDTTVTPQVHDLTVQVNHEEWVPLGVFWSGDWSAPEDGVYAQTTGRDRLELLRKSTYSTSQVQVNKTLYDLALAVLQDAGLKPEEYWVDTELQQFTIPYAYFEPQSHREALRKIAEACLGQVYCDRDGVVRVEGPSFLAKQTQSVLTLTQDDYFRKDNPVKWSEIANYVEVETQPLRPVSTPEEVYRSNEPVPIAAGETKTLTVFFNQTPCIEASASLQGAPTGCVIQSAMYYAWGAEVKVYSPNAGSFTLVVNAKPLKVMNKEKAVAKDDASITDNGLIRYTFPPNPLVQTLSMAQTIADKLLASFKNPRRDVEVEWRGNPALLLGDRVTVVDKLEQNDYFVTRQEIDWTGALRARLSGRRVV